MQHASPNVSLNQGYVRCLFIAHCKNISFLFLVFSELVPAPKVILTGTKKEGTEVTKSYRNITPFATPTQETDSQLNDLTFIGLRN